MTTVTRPTPPLEMITLPIPPPPWMWISTLQLLAHPQMNVTTILTAIWTMMTTQNIINPFILFSFPWCHWLTLMLPPQELYRVHHARLCRILVRVTKACTNLKILEKWSTLDWYKTKMVGLFYWTPYTKYVISFLGTYEKCLVIFWNFNIFNPTNKIH